jgi:hypothetical protein
MSGEVITIIVSALVAAVAGPLGSWIGRKVERAKYEVEVGKLRAELKGKIAEVKSHELENVRKASDILMQSIVPPLRSEINKLRNDVQRLNAALERIWGCPHVERCPVKYELLLPTSSAEKHQSGNAGRGDDNPAGGDAERTGTRADP